MSNDIVKRCNCCGQQYTETTWRGLHYVGLWELDQPLELRNCTCGSTLALPVMPDSGDTSDNGHEGE